MDEDRKPLNELELNTPSGSTGDGAGLKEEASQTQAQSQRDQKPDLKPKSAVKEREKVELDLTGVEDVAAFDPDTYTPEAAIAKASAIAANLGILLSPRNFGDNGGKRLEGWQDELKALQDKIKAQPEFLVAVVGSTGSGKSTMINALLHSDNLVPTNSIRACTAVVTEISYNYEDDKIKGQVEFLTAAEWRAELEILRSDLIDDDGNCRRVGDETSEAGAAWAKVHSVYPDLHQNAEYGVNFAEKSVDQLMKRGIAGSHLGKTINISASTSDEFGRKIGVFIDSKEKDLGGKRKKGEKKDKNEKAPQEYWALIKKVKVFVKADALSTGAIVVDLPGVADSNQARGRIAKEYMKTASAMWICAPQTRAVDDKVARDLMGSAFKRQLQMDGAFDRLTFVTTSSDNLSAREVMRSIPSLQATLEDVEEGLEKGIDDKKESGKATKAAKAELAEADAALKTAQADLEEWNERLECKESGKTFVSKAAQAAKAAALKKKSGKKGGKAAAKAKPKSKGGKGKGKKSKATSDDSDSEMDDFIVDDESSAEEEESASDSDSDSDNDTPKKKRKITPDSDDSDIEVVDDDEEGAKKKRGDEEDEEEVEFVDEADDMDEEEIKAIIKEKKETIKELRKVKKAKKDHVDSCTAATTKIEKKMSKLQREKNRQCALARNEYSKKALQEDFRSGLQILDDEAAELRLGDNWNPDERVRDYDTIFLPVFCVSSREFAKLNGLASGDGKAQVFSHSKETGIPALRQHCKALTLKPRFTRAYRILKEVNDLLASIRLYLAAGGNGGQDADSVRHAFRQQIQVVKADLYQLAKDAQENANDTFDAKIKPYLEAGASKSAESAPSNMRAYDDLNWGTYRATTRRNGVFTSGARGPQNMNLALVKPLLDQVSVVWASVFEAPETLIGNYKRDCLRAIDTLADTLSESSSPSGRSQFQQVAKQTKHQLENRLTAWIDLVLDDIDAKQRDASRSIEPAVESQLMDTYNRSATERGAGSSRRMKAVMNDFIEAERHNLFTDCTEELMDKLYDITLEIGEKLEKAVDTVITITSDNFSTLWQKLGFPDYRTKELRALVLAAIQREEAAMQVILATSLESPPVQPEVEESEEEEEQEQQRAKKKSDKKGKGKAITLSDDEAPQESAPLKGGPVETIDVD